MTEAQQRICEIFDDVEEEFESKSFEWQIQMTCDRYEIETGREIDGGDVMAALAQQADESGRDEATP